MYYVKLLYNLIFDSYQYVDASDIGMSNLGLFFVADVGIRGNNSFRNWALATDENAIVGGNVTFIEMEKKLEGSYVLLSDQCSEEEFPTELKMTVKQFVQLCDDWQEKVVKQKPKEVTIKHEHGEFFIETSD